MNFLLTTFDHAGPVRKAIADLAAGLRAWRLWFTLAWWDARRPYTRTLIGPLWEPLGFLGLIALIGPLFGPSLAPHVESPTLFLAIGYALWHFISGILLDGSQALVRDGAMLQQIRLPISLFAFRVLARNFIVLLSNFAVIVVTDLVVGYSPSWDLWLALPGLALLLWIGAAFSLALAFLGARWPDLGQFLLLGVRVAFFLTPVLWHPGVFVGGAANAASRLRLLYVDYNPFFHVIDVVRAPLVGQTVAPISWYVVGGIAVIASAIAFTFLTIWNRRAVYWI